MDNNTEAKLSLISTSKINGRNVWHYIIDSAIGRINIVQYEQPSMEIKSFIYEEGYFKAENKYNQLCRNILSGKM